MCPIRVAVHGALGKMGKEVAKAVSLDPETQLVGAVDIKASTDFLPLTDIPGQVPISKNLEEIINKTMPQVIVDFSVAKAAMPAIRTASRAGINLVVGTTGFAQEDYIEIESLAKENNTGIIVAPNFALGAVLMMHLAKVAAKYFDYAEIIELHHNQKLDAPSGTALGTAQAMAKEKGRAFQVPPGEIRGKQVEGITIHSIRLPGLMAHQEVIFGAAGQTLSIRHDTINRECYMPGVMLAVKQVVNIKGFILGLDKLLGL